MCLEGQTPNTGPFVSAVRTGEWISDQISEGTRPTGSGLQHLRGDGLQHLSLSGTHWSLTLEGETLTLRAATHWMPAEGGQILAHGRGERR